MFTNRKKSWVLIGGALLLVLVAGAITASIAAGERPLRGRAGLSRMRFSMMPHARRFRRRSRMMSSEGLPSSKADVQPGSDLEGVDDVALQQA